jgi:hypothetical protein
MRRVYGSMTTLEVLCGELAEGMGVWCAELYDGTIMLQFDSTGSFCTFIYDDEGCTCSMKVSLGPVVEDKQLLRVEVDDMDGFQLCSPCSKMLLALLAT